MILKIYFLLIISSLTVKEIVSTCSLDNLKAIKMCNDNFTNGLENVVAAAAQKIITKAQACSQADSVYAESQQCFGRLQQQCGQDQSFLQNKILTDQRFSFMKNSLKCNATGGGLGSCSTLVQIAMTACYEQFSTSFASVQQNMNVTSLNPQLVQTMCSTLKSTLNTTNKCLDKAGTGHQGCDTLVQAQKASIKDIVDQFSTICGSDGGKCSPILIQGCAANIQMPSFNVTSTNFKEMCSVMSGVLSCLDNYRSQCRTTYEQVIPQEISAQFDMLRKICSPECKDFNLKLVAMEQCIKNLPTVNVYTYNSICGHIQDIISCTSTSMGSCTYLEDMMKPQLPGLLQAVNNYGCDITIGSHTYKPTGCSLDKLSSCDNPILQAVGLPPLTRDSNLTQFMTQLKNSNLTNEANYGQICSDVQSSNVNLKAVGTCYLAELSKCLPGFMAPTDQSYGKWRKTQANFITQNTFNLGDTLNKQALESAHHIFDMVHSNVRKIDMDCSDCTNATSSTSQLFQCTSQNLGIVITDNTKLIALMTDVITKYNKQQDYTAECNKVETLANCTNQYMAGCKRTEYVMSSIVNKINTYPAVRICNITFDFKLKDELISCDNTDFVKLRKERLHTVCKASRITEHDDLSQMTAQGVCSIIQEQIHCYTSNAQCCMVKREVLEPMIQRWGMMSNLLGCSSLMLEMKANTKGLDINPAGSNCNYNAMLTCYKPILSKVGIDVNSLKNISPQVLMNLFKVKHKMLQNPSMCVSNNEFTIVETCVGQLVKSCKYPTLCETMNSTPKMTSTNMLPLADIIDLQAIKYICGQDCRGMTFPNTTYTDCNVMKFKEVSSNVVWNDLRGVGYAQYCRDIKAVSDCIVPKVGKCQHRVMELREKLDLNSVMGQTAAAKCNVTFSPLTQTTSPAPTTPTKGTVSGAESIQSTLILVLLITLMSWTL